MSKRLVATGFGVGLLFALTGCPQVQVPDKLTPAKSGERTTVYGKALDRADKSVCEQYVAQLNQTAMMYKQEHETYPPDLPTLIKESKLPASELQNCQYNYDPNTGRVSIK